MAVVIVFIWAQLPLAADLPAGSGAGDLRTSSTTPPRSMARAPSAASGRSRCRASGRCWSIVALFEALMAITNFDLVYALTQGGPGTATTLVTYFTWAESFRKLDFGAGAALAIMIALGSLAVDSGADAGDAEGRAGGGARDETANRRCAGSSSTRGAAAGVLLVRAVRAGRHGQRDAGGESDLVPAALVRRSAQSANVRLHLHRQGPAKLRAAGRAAQHDLQRGARCAPGHPATASSWPPR